MHFLVLGSARKCTCTVCDVLSKLLCTVEITVHCQIPNPGINCIEFDRLID